MLFGLLATFFIVSSMGVVSNTAPVLDKSKEAPTIQKAPQPKKENENNNLIHFTLDIDGGVGENYTTTTTQTISNAVGQTGSLDAYTNMQKYHGNVENSAMKVWFNYVTTNITFDAADINDIPWWTNPWDNSYSYLTLADSDKFKNCGLIALCIDPYQNFVEEETASEYYFEMDFNTLNPTVNLEIQYICSTDARFYNYYLMSNDVWKNGYFIKNRWEAMTSPVNGFNYKSVYQTINNINGETDYVNTSTDRLNIVPGKRNYIFALVSLTDNNWNIFTSAEGQNQYGQYLWIEKTNISGHYMPTVSNYEIIDIPSLVYNIITLPFAFVSTAFNVTLWPGTPYQLNLSALVLAFIGALVIIWILKNLIKWKG